VTAASHLTTLRELVDVDQDGRPDLAEYSDDPYVAPSVRLSAGDEFLPARVLPLSYGRGRRNYRSDASSWHLEGAVIDLDGNGITDLVDWTGRTMVTESASGGPPRLLQTVDNGRGKITRFTYAAAGTRG